MTDAERVAELEDLLSRLSPQLKEAVEKTAELEGRIEALERLSVLSELGVGGLTSPLMLVEMVYRDPISYIMNSGHWEGEDQ